MDHFLGRNDEQMQCRGILHIVEAGDTLYKIGKKHGVPVSRIMYANPYVNVYNLQVGDEICVPVMSPRMPAGENGVPGQMDPVRTVPMQQDRMGRREPGMQEERRREQEVPAQTGYTDGARMPARGNYMGDPMTPARENYMENTRIPMQESKESPLAPLRQIIVDIGREETDRAYTGNGIDSAGEGSMQDAAREDAVKGRGMNKQEDMGGAWENAPMEDGCMEPGKECPRMNASKVLPWDDTEVSQQMMDHYLDTAPK